jgi:hypothetical protein
MSDDLIIKEIKKVYNCKNDEQTHFACQIMIKEHIKTGTSDDSKVVSIYEAFT